MPIKNFIDQLFDGKEEREKASKQAKDFGLKEKERGVVQEKAKKGQEKKFSEKEIKAKEKEILAKLPPKPKTTTKDKDAKAEHKEILEVESIMEEDLEEVYQRMDPDLKNKFKEKGEETATAISQIIKKTKVKANEILELIKAWLKLVPGINKFFLEQEAKIKTDKILALKKQKDNNKK